MGSVARPLDVVDADPRAHFARQLDVSAGKEIPRPRKMRVRRDKILSRYAVAVGEDEIIASRGTNRSIEDFSLSKCTVFVPHV